MEMAKTSLQALSDDEDTSAVGFIATSMVSVSLPHSAQPDVAVFKRKNGQCAVTIMNDPEIGLPYGKIPRIISAFLSSEAKRTGARVLSIGDNQSEFMHMLGMGVTGGQNGTIARLHDQAKRLFTSAISITQDDGSLFKWNKLSLADEGYLLWDPHAKEGQQWRGEIVLSEKFHKECVEHAVPVSMSTIHELRSPLAIDLYVWMTYRYNTITRPTTISWKQLQAQFAVGYPQTQQGMLDFKKNFRQQIAAVSQRYTWAKYRLDERGMTLLPSKPHVMVSVSK